MFRLLQLLRDVHVVVHAEHLRTLHRRQVLQTRTIRANLLNRLRSKALHVSCEVLCKHRYKFVHFYLRRRGYLFIYLLSYLLFNRKRSTTQNEERETDMHNRQTDRHSIITQYR